MTARDCYVCGGAGFFHDAPYCPYCNGTGKLQPTEAVKIALALQGLRQARLESELFREGARAHRGWR
jgi:DnaJ-class molecular chaperone